MSDKKPFGYWTYDRCLEEAKKYKLKVDFKKNAAGAYDAAKDKGWLVEYTWLENRPLKWTYETCFEEAKKYKTRSEFSKLSGSAYNVARKNNWLNDYNWFDNKQKPSGYWTYDRCLEEAKKYKSRGEFSQKSWTAYDYARRRKWLDDYSWLVSIATPAGFWTYEKCYEEAKKYKTRLEFIKQAGYVYKLAQKKGWLDDYIWLGKKFVWSFETCSAIAKQYKTKKEFKQGNSSAYYAASKHRWLKCFDWLKSSRVNAITENVDNVYMYYFEYYNAIYIGRTINTKRRDREHIFNTDRDTVAKFAVEHNCSVPPMIILEENLSLDKGQEREDYWVNHYKEQGFIVLNRAKTGIGIGSLGTIGATKWTKKKCYEEAKMYSYRKEFQLGSVGAYTQALKRGWLDDYTWFERPRNWNQKWDRDTCYEEALKYNKPSQFEDNSPGAYRAAKKNGWLSDYTWIKTTSKPAGYWTYETCYEEAKRYRSRGELKKNAKTAYRTALKNGWLDDYTWFEILWKPKWDRETCFKEAKKYHSKTSFRKQCPSGYVTACKHGWLDEFFPNPHRGDLDYEACKRLASQYSNSLELLRADRSLYRTIKKRGWMNDFFPEK